MVLVGMVLALLLRGDLLIGALILLMMTLAAAMTASRQLKGVASGLLISFWAILAGSGLVIGSHAGDRHAQIEYRDAGPRRQHDHCQCDERLCAGRRTVPCRCDHPYRPGRNCLGVGRNPHHGGRALCAKRGYASLLPRLDMLKSLGLVWIPGVMAGMMVSGASPVYAGIYQFIIVAIILAASGVTGMVAVVLMRQRTFSAAAQLILRQRREGAARP